MATGVTYPTKEHISSAFSTGIHERAEGQDIDPVAIRRKELLAQLAELGVEPEEVETPEETKARLKAEYDALNPQERALAGAVPGT